MKSTFNKQFLTAWLRNPLQTGAIVPSGLALATAMSAQVEPDNGMVVELGAGTGVITRALLIRGVAPERLILIEKDPSLCKLLKQHFPKVHVLGGDAGRMKALLTNAGLGAPGTIVSSLPLLSLPGQVRMRILSQIFSILETDGKLVQFTYSPLPPISAALATSLRVSGSRVARVPWNLPPAAVWVYKRHR